MQSQILKQNIQNGQKKVDKIHPLLKPLSEHDLDFNNINDLMKVQGRYYELSSFQLYQHAQAEKSYMDIHTCWDPHHPMFYHTYQNSLPPEIAYRVVNSKTDIVTKDLESITKIGYKRRFIYGWKKNWTQFEKEQIQKVKDVLKQQHGIDLSLIKDFGQNKQEDVWLEGMQQKIVNGKDIHFDDEYILRFLCARQFDIKKVIDNLLKNLKWRESVIPLPKLTDASLNLLNKRLIYIHGRTKDLSPIVIIDFKRLQEFLENNEIDAEIYCNLHHFIHQYVTRNLLIPGQVERWITIANLNKFPLIQMPRTTFKESNDNVASNYIDGAQKIYVVNMTWIQNMIAKILQSFMDPETINKVTVAYAADSPEIKKFIHPSQLEVRHGGTAPDVTRYWPPIMPEYKEFEQDPQEPQCKIIPRDQYNSFYMDNQELTLMPKMFREDLPPLPMDQSMLKVTPPSVSGSDVSLGKYIENNFNDKSNYHQEEKSHYINSNEAPIEEQAVQYQSPEFTKKEKERQKLMKKPAIKQESSISKYSQPAVLQIGEENLEQSHRIKEGLIQQINVFNVFNVKKSKTFSQYNNNNKRKKVEYKNFKEQPGRNSVVQQNPKECAQLIASGGTILNRDELSLYTPRRKAMSINCCHSVCNPHD